MTVSEFFLEVSCTDKLMGIEHECVFCVLGEKIFDPNDRVSPIVSESYEVQMELGQLPRQETKNLYL